MSAPWKLIFAGRIDCPGVPVNATADDRLHLESE